MSHESPSSRSASMTSSARSRSTGTAWACPRRASSGPNSRTAPSLLQPPAGPQLALWPRRSLAADSGVPLQPPSATEFSLAHNVASQAEVDALMRQAERAGATIVKTAQPTFYGGYAGYFQDPDGHLWRSPSTPGSIHWAERWTRSPSLRESPMINGAHAILYSREPEKDLAFLRDVLKLPHVDVGHGWLIFALPPAEVAVHPTDGGRETRALPDDRRRRRAGDDVAAAVRQLATHQGGLLRTHDNELGRASRRSRLPGGGTPRHLPAAATPGPGA